MKNEEKIKYIQKSLLAIEQPSEARHRNIQEFAIDSETKSKSFRVGKVKYVAKTITP